MKRILNELPIECEITVQMYAQGYEKKEIASMKCRALSTINNQIQTAMAILHVRNGRELAKMLYERMAGMSFTLDFSEGFRTTVACCLLFMLCFDGHLEMRRQRTNQRTTNTEIAFKTRNRARGKDISLLAA